MIFSSSKLTVSIMVVLTVLATLMPAMAAVPSYSDLDDPNIPEQTVTIIDNDVTISNSDGTGFGSGYLEFNLSNSTSYDDMNIKSSGSPNSSGAISVNGTDVYIGTGSAKVKIGTINSTYDGQDGQNLRIEFVNDSYEVGSLPDNNDFETGDTTGWIINQSVSNVPNTSELRHVMNETRDDSNPDEGGGYDLDNEFDIGGDANSHPDSVNQQTSIVSSPDAYQGDHSLSLSNSGNSQPYGYIWGPSVTSSNFSADAGDRILFDWMAQQTSDYYVAYALLIDNDNSNTEVLFADQGSSSSWQTKEVVITQNSNDLQFKFILGSYDNSGGEAVGATMRIDNIRTMVVTDTAVSSLAQSITHNYTGDNPSGKVVTGRTLTISTEDSDSETSSTTATLSVYGEGPSFNSGTAFTLSENETNQTTVFYDAQADNGDGGTDDQDITYSIVGGDAQTLFDIDADDGEVRLNALGVSTLDYETATDHSLQIQADDGQAVNGTVTQTITVNITDVNSSLSLGNIDDRACDWGRDFSLNHSIASSADAANGVTIDYNVSWITDGSPGVVNADSTEWHNQTLVNSTPQKITVLLNGNSTDTSATNDSSTFDLNITKRDIVITSDPETSHSVNPGTLIWINGSAKGEYNETFIGKAVLTLNGNTIGSPKNVTDGNASFNSSRSAGGTYNYAIRFYNTSYYHNESTNNSVLTVNVPPSDDNSGFRTSVGPSQPQESILSTETSLKHIMGGSSVKYDLSDGEDPVIGISFDAKDNEGLVVAKVEVLKNKPSDVPEPAGQPYSVMSINVGSEGTISEHNAENLLIHFKVSWEWIKENNIDPDTIRLTRFHDEEWQELSGTLESDDGEFLYFNAKTPGFSIFSVVGDSFEAELTEEKPEKIIPEEKEQISEPVKGNDQKTPGFTGLSLIIVVSFVFFLLRKNEQ